MIHFARIFEEQTIHSSEAGNGAGLRYRQGITKCCFPRIKEYIDMCYRIESKPVREREGGRPKKIKKKKRKKKRKEKKGGKSMHKLLLN